MPTPEIPDERLATIAQWAITRMSRAERPLVAERILGAAGQRVRDPRIRADILMDGAEARLAKGHVPRHLTKAYTAQLQRADEEHAAGRWAAAGSEATRALLLAYHRVLHVDGLSSPLAEHPDRFTGPLRRSRAAKALRRPRGRRGAAEAPPAGRRQRMLFVHHDNDNFLRPVMERYADHPDVEVRVLDTAADPVVGPLAKGVTRIVQRAMGGQVAYGKELEAALRPHLDWADTVFIDWCAMAAAVFTLVDPADTRIVVRLHSYEAFSLWPHIVDFSRVDDLIFVSEHLRDMCVAAVPALKEKGAPRLHVVDNAVELAPFARPKADDARFTLGLVGVGQVAKDPRWALEVLRLLREKDERYRLHLIGSPMDPGMGPAAARYHRDYARELARLEAAGAVRHIGQTPDVPGALSEVGVILSSSVRESWHLGLVEGAASGAVPVVRDWPFFAAQPHGARALFPDSWVVATPEEAAARVLRLTATEEDWRKAGSEAAAHAMAAWDWAHVQGDFDQLLLAADRAVCSPDGEAAEALGKAAE
ncbi:glycosyltransferase [Streptomyces solicathayae]|uniref:D-inositol 3-phosphate glycosyltransferase n=1 Tax=Streptomyces solicathayae TaxID=3081768 RepID=A0ABZ0LY14_9ACTN|nr:hypothetical protein [Streptomyces sp. HUAS YS2]WOX24401.1 hypothetical protein R2D22_24675 [Streptomyces sp. HUAS YS2]